LISSARARGGDEKILRGATGVSTLHKNYLNYFIFVQKDEAGLCAAALAGV
jgi:hypothetical protein